MGKGCDCSHCPGCGDAHDEPKKKGPGAAVEPENTEEEDLEEIDLGDDDSFDDDDEEE